VNPEQRRYGGSISSRLTRLALWSSRTTRRRFRRRQICGARPFRNPPPWHQIRALLAVGYKIVIAPPASGQRSNHSTPRARGLHVQEVLESSEAPLATNMPARLFRFAGFILTSQNQRGRQTEAASNKSIYRDRYMPCTINDRDFVFFARFALISFWPGVSLNALAFSRLSKARMIIRFGGVPSNAVILSVRAT
jgi:hypothetical protein